MIICNSNSKSVEFSRRTTNISLNQWLKAIEIWNEKNQEITNYIKIEFFSKAISEDQSTDKDSNDKAFSSIKYKAEAQDDYNGIKYVIDF